jgi:DNA-binding GntR family transcriptional regulator
MLVKESLRDQVKSYLQERMLNGKISFGERIPLQGLSEKLGVSVTPVREALTQLVQANIVKAIPNRGFFLARLNNKEAKDVLPIIATLEHLAVSGSEYTKENIDHLERIQNKAESSKAPVSKLKLDIKFHETLLQNFNNDLMKQVVNDLRIRVSLYEFYYLEDPQMARISASFHRGIIDSLRQNDTQKAADLTRESWLCGIDFIEEQFD